MKRTSLLNKTSPVEIFKHYLPTESNFEEACIKIKNVQSGRNILSPFVKEKNPSFSVYQEGDKLKYKCWASGPSGDCFQLVADLKGIDCKTNFNQVLETINRDMRLGLEYQKPNYQSQNWKAEYYESMVKRAVDFWEARNIDSLTLEAFGVKQLRKLTYINSAKKRVQFHFHKNGEVAFEYTVNGRKKLYVPSGANPKLAKKYFCKTQVNEDIFGLRQLPNKKQKFLLICEGESDVMCATAHGLPAVCFQSANSYPTKRQIRLLKRKASTLVLCYDMDEPGRKGANKICYRFPSIVNLLIPKSNHYHIGENKGDEGEILYWSTMTPLQKETYEPDLTTELKTYKDLSDWLPCASVQDFRAIIDRGIKDNRKRNFLHIWESGHSYMKYNKKTNEKEEVSNFLLEVEAQILTEEESLRLCRLTARDYKTETLAIPSSVLNSDTKFSDYVTNLRGNFRFQGTKKDLQVIQKMTFEQSEHLEEVSKMGWKNKHNCFVLSNRVLNGKIMAPNEEGILNDLYIPAANLGNLDNSLYANDLRYRYQQDSKIKEVDQFFAIISKSYSPQIAVMAFSFLFSGLFFDWIARKGVSNWFPILGVFGQKGSGKGSLIKMLMKLFTSEPEEVSVTNATKTGFIRTLGQVDNIHMWLDEFRNTVGSEKIEAIKNIYDLIGKVIGFKSNDSRTKRSKILRATFLSGQEAPTNEALFSRTICLNLNIVDKTPEQAMEFAKNMTELDKGIGDVLFKLLQYRPLIIQHFKTEYFQLVEFFGKEVAKKGGKANIRLLNNYAAIIAPLTIALENGLTLFNQKSTNNEPINWTAEKQILAVRRMALNTLMDQAQEESQLDEVNRFLEILMILANRKPTDGGLLIDYDFKVSLEDNELIIKSSVISGFNKMHRAVFDQEGPDQSAIKKYLPSKPYFKRKRRECFEAYGKGGRVQMRSHVLHLDQLPEEQRDYFTSIAPKSMSYAEAEN